MQGRGRRLGRRSGFVALLLVVAACGSRTGLFGPEDDAPGTPVDAAIPRTDAPFPIVDGRVPDTSPTVGLDALPPIDASPPIDVNRTDCPDADSTLVYVVSSENELYAFYPPDLGFRFIGALACPAPAGTSPFSMAVDRRGVAYVLYTDGNLYRVSTLTAACVATTYVPNQQAFATFGMGFAADSTSPTNERLFVAESGGGVGPQPSRGLAHIDTSTFALTFVGPFAPSLPRAEFTGTADGRLFAYWPQGSDATPLGSIAEVDIRNAQIRARVDVPIGTSSDAFAFAFYGGDFWMFNSGQSTTSTAVSRFRLADGTTSTPTTFPGRIVGAGVSTCAPSF